MFNLKKNDARKIFYLKHDPENRSYNQAECEHSKSAGAQRGKGSDAKQKVQICNFTDPFFDIFSSA